MTDQGGEEPIMWRQRDDDLSWREIDEEVIVLDLRTARYLRLNPAGAFLWAILAPGATASGLAERLAGHFHLEVAQAQSETADFIASCASLGIIEPMSA